MVHYVDLLYDVPGSKNKDLISLVQNQATVLQTELTDENTFSCMTPYRLCVEHIQCVQHNVMGEATPLARIKVQNKCSKHLIRMHC